MQKLLNFSLENIALYDDDSNEDFCVAKLEFLASGQNSHKNPIDVKVLKKYANSVLGKFVIGEYNPLKTDTTSHSDNQQIYGYVPPNGTVYFEDKKNKTFASVDAVISKIYAAPIVNMFKTDNHRWVSCEFSADMKFDDNELKPGEDNPILGFNIRGITILGKGVRPSCEGAQMKMLKFAKEEAEDYYNTTKDSLSALKLFAKERREKMAKEKTYKINTSKDSVSDAEWDGEKTKHDAILAENFETIAPKIFLRLEDGWKDKEVTKLDYPVMTLEGDTFVYSKKGLASAEGYAKKENETEVLNKVIAIKKKLGLNDEGDDTKKMEKEFSAVQIDNLWGKVYDFLSTAYPDKDYGSIYRIQGIYEEDNKKFAVINKKDEATLYRLNFDLTENEISFADTIVEVEQAFLEKEDSVRKFSECPNEKYSKFSESNEQKEEKMSLDANIDAAALLEMLKDETEDNKKLANDVLAEMQNEDKTIIMNRVIGMAKEISSLKEFKEQKEKEEVKFATDKILMEVKEDLTPEEFASFQTKAMGCTKDTVDGFANEAKAFAYNKSKGKEKNTENKKFSKMAFQWNNYVPNGGTLSATDIYDKVLNT